jgi:DNA-binding MarR family transcriptional regulator
MNRPASDDLQVLDEALVRLRRLWTASRAHVVDDLGRRVEMSSVLVVEACARAESTLAEVTVGDVAAFLDVEASTASRMVERATAAGLVLRTPSRVDGRRAALRLTDSGRGLRARATAARLGWLGAVVAQWPPEDVHVLASVLTRFADAVAATPPPAGAEQGPPRRPH